MGNKITGKIADNRHIGAFFMCKNFIPAISYKGVFLGAKKNKKIFIKKLDKFFIMFYNIIVDNDNRSQ